MHSPLAAISSELAARRLQAQGSEQSEFTSRACGNLRDLTDLMGSSVQQRLGSILHHRPVELH